jgi:hypothetical protein
MLDATIAERRSSRCGTGRGGSLRRGWLQPWPAGWWQRPPATNGDNDQELTGATRDRAVAAALAATAGGTVLETEAGDDGAAYGVGVRLDDGRQIEVNLDESFKVVNQAPDEDRPNEGADRWPSADPPPGSPWH